MTKRVTSTEYPTGLGWEGAYSRPLRVCEAVKVFFGFWDIMGLYWFSTVEVLKLSQFG